MSHVCSRCRAYCEHAEAGVHHVFASALTGTSCDSSPRAKERLLEKLVSRSQKPEVRHRTPGSEVLPTRHSSKAVFASNFLLKWLAPLLAGTRCNDRLSSSTDPAPPKPRYAPQRCFLHWPLSFAWNKCCLATQLSRTPEAPCSYRSSHILRARQVSTILDPSKQASQPVCHHIERFEVDRVLG